MMLYPHAGLFITWSNVLNQFITAIAIILQINGAALAQNETLLTVAHNRQISGYVEREINPDVDVESYKCRVALPNRYASLIGDEVFFVSESGGVWGPWLIVDIQSNVDDRLVPMEKYNLLADIDCPHMYHKKGKLVMVNGVKRGHELLWLRRNKIKILTSD